MKVKTVRTIEFHHSGTLIEVAEFVRTTLMGCYCENHGEIVFYEPAIGIVGRFYVTLEGCCDPVLSKAELSLGQGGLTSVRGADSALRYIPNRLK